MRGRGVDESWGVVSHAPIVHTVTHVGIISNCRRKVGGREGGRGRKKGVQMKSNKM